MPQTVSLSVHFKPLPKQETFLSKALLDEDTRFIWYVGGFGSGKTTIGVVTCIELCMAYPRNRGVIARSKFVDLKATTMSVFKETIENAQLEPILEGGSWDNAFDGQNNLLSFANGSEIYFWGLDYRSEEQLKSLELGFFYLDEVNEIPEKAFTILRGRLRKKNTPRRVGIITSNPEGQNWTYHYFVNHTFQDIEGAKRLPMKDVDKKKYFYITAPSTENIYLPKSYIDELNSYQGILHRRFVLGEFATFAGQIYDELEPSVHFIPRFEVSKEWYAYGVNGALDYGSTNPTAVGKFAICPDDDSIILTDLFYKGNSKIADNAPMIRTMFGLPREGTEILYLYADPSTFNKTQEVKNDEINKQGTITIADRFWDYKIRLIPAKNAVLAGIETVKKYIQKKENRAHIIHKASPAPQFYIFDDLKEVIDEILQYKWNPEMQDTPGKRNDHACDMIRYFFATSPLLNKPLEQYPDDPSDLNAIWKKQLKRFSDEVSFKQNNTNYGNNFDSTFDF